MIKHCQEEGSSSELVSGFLVGIVVGTTLEITNCFPLPKDLDDGEEESMYMSFTIVLFLPRCRHSTVTVNYVLLVLSLSCKLHTHTTGLTDQYQVNILKKLRAINVDYHQVGWYQSTYLSSHVTKEFLESHVRYQQAISESVVLILSLIHI